MDTVHGAGECRGGRSGRFDGVRVFLDDLRSPFNIGSVFRTSEAFGVSEIILSPDCPSPGASAGAENLYGVYRNCRLAG